ncbi:hypothetical protein RchiOBHm_Chr5g0052381 [Rosa chinensis]|uniref:Uncharacterized protein n=1 Tax=Rosa chinensis TaxID=74649 RepID=A0A2P6QFN7_ROSCH|nr:hypothetical protein RchiOBHm_Chr5g0052381 [Rosa chinensis]
MKLPIELVNFNYLEFVLQVFFTFDLDYDDFLMSVTCSVAGKSLDFTMFWYAND